MDVRRSKRGRAAALAAWLALVATMLLAAAPAAVLAGGKGATTLDGIQQAAGSCGGDGYAMTGSLEGCWWIDTFDTGKSDPDKSHYRATGTEHFTGCLGTVCGTFYTTFSFTAKTDGPFPTAAEIHGRCHHPLLPDLGTGGFAGASGEISFHDVVDVDPPYYPYWGNVHLART